MHPIQCCSAIVIALTNLRKEPFNTTKLTFTQYNTRERSPEAVLNILLFRKYADMANQIKDSVDNSSEKQLFINAIGTYLHTCLLS